MKGTIIIAGRPVTVNNIELIKVRQAELIAKEYRIIQNLKRHRLLPTTRTNCFAEWCGSGNYEQRTASQLEPDRQIREAKILAYTPR